MLPSLATPFCLLVVEVGSIYCHNTIIPYLVLAMAFEYNICGLGREQRIIQRSKIP
jgi:hypothetical protein